jgi:isocitrate lyase
MTQTIEEKAIELCERLSCHVILEDDEERIQDQWDNDPRWNGIQRPYTPEDVLKLRGTLKVEYSFAEAGAKRLWHLLQTEDYIAALGALTGNMAVQQVEAGLQAIYLSGWQVAADANLAGEMYPDQSLYPSNSVPEVVKRINRALRRADQIQVLDGRKNGPYWFAPIVADAEAGFGGALNAFELMKQMIEAGAAGVHFEDQLASAKKCGHLGGKVLVPTQEFINKLVSARLAADTCGVPTVLVARTDAEAAKLLTSDVDERDKPFIINQDRTSEGFYYINNGVDTAIARGLAYAPYADMVWCETSRPNLDEAKKFAEGIKSEFPDKLLAYNCSPSFNWKSNLTDSEIAKFQTELGAMGYKFQFVTLAGFQEEFAHGKEDGYMAITHQKFVGTGYFDRVMNCVTGGESSVEALEDSTEKAQF